MGVYLLANLKFWYRVLKKVASVSCSKWNLFFEKYLFEGFTPIGRNQHPTNLQPKFIRFILFGFTISEKWLYFDVRTFKKRQKETLSLFYVYFCFDVSYFILGFLFRMENSFLRGIIWLCRKFLIERNMLSLYCYYMWIY